MPSCPAVWPEQHWQVCPRDRRCYCPHSKEDGRKHMFVLQLFPCNAQYIPLSRLHWHVQARPWTFPEATQSTPHCTMTAPSNRSTAAKRWGGGAWLHSTLTTGGEGKGGTGAASSLNPAPTQPPAGTYRHTLLCLSDPLWINTYCHLTLESISHFGGPHGPMNLASGHD